MDPSLKKKQEKLMEQWHRTTDAICRLSPPDVIYPKIYELFRSAMDMDDFLIAILKKKGNRIHCRFRVTGKVTLKVPEKCELDFHIFFLIRHVMGKKKATYIKKGAIASLHPKAGTHPLKIPSASFLGVPIQAGNRVSGAILIQFSNEEIRHKSSDIRMFETISHQLGLYMLHREMKRKFKKNTQLLTEAEKHIHLLSSTSESNISLRKHFLARMNHEIRTPLNGIMGNIELLSETILTNEQKEYQKAIMLSADHLIGVVNNLLDYSRIETGEMRVDPEPFDIRSAMESIIQKLAVMARAKNISLRWKISPDIPPFIAGDTEKLRYILISLGENSIGLTHSGSVVFSVNGDGFEKKKIKVCFTVSDSGIGIDKKKVSSILTSQEQSIPFRPDSYDPAELKLSISHRLIEMMGGELTISSREGKGSTFQFTVPFEPLQDTSIHTRGKEKDTLTTEVSAAPLTILLVEDNDINREMTLHILEKQHHIVRIAKNGLEALSIFEKQKVDLVLMDIDMPVMDGITATIQIREKEKKNATHTPIIAMTAFSFKEDRARCIEAGMDDHIAKPVDPQHLKRMISIWHDHLSQED